MRELMERLMTSGCLNEGSAWKKMVKGGGTADSMLEKAIAPYNKELADNFIKGLPKSVYSDTLGKSYMGYGHVILIGEGYNKSDMEVKWELHVDNFGDKTRLTLKFKTPQMKSQRVERLSVNGGKSPSSEIGKLSGILARA